MTSDEGWNKVICLVYKTTLNQVRQTLKLTLSQTSTQYVTICGPNHLPSEDVVNALTGKLHVRIA